jgi:ComG operon protein 7
VREKGIVYPLVVTLCFIILLFIGFVAEKVFSEREFVYLQEQQLKQYRLAEQAVKRASEIAAEWKGFPNEHKLYLNEGYVKIVIHQTTEDERLFVIDSITDRKHTKRIKVYYNVKQKSVIKWVEG